MVFVVHYSVYNCPVKQQYVFIDDSGDPGFKSHPSPYFVMACAVFMEGKIAERVAQDIHNFRKLKGWGDEAEFKFRLTRKSTIKELLYIVSRHNFRVSAVYVDKMEVQEVLRSTDKLNLYNSAIKTLLCAIPLRDAKVRIDGRSSKENMLATASYLRRELNKTSHKVQNIKFEDSKRNDLIQLADIIAGSINRSLQKEKTDSNDYVAIFKSKIDIVSEMNIA